MTPEWPLFLDGAEVRSERVATLCNPYDGAEVARVHQATPAHLEAAAAAAARCFETTRRWPTWRRVELLEALTTRLRAEAEALARDVVRQSGKTIRDARGELARTVGTFQLAAEEAKRLGGEIQSLDFLAAHEGRTALVRRFPVGPVLGIAPFNFPHNLVAHKVAPALAVGNPVVLKPASATPLSALQLARLAAECGAPPGLLSVVPTDRDTADRLVADERFALLSFTGSPAAGWPMRARAGRKKVVLELGGNAALIVARDADLDRAAARTVYGAFCNAGQVCISVQRIYMEAPVADAFTERLLARTRALKVGDPMDERTDVGPMITAAAAARAERMLHEATAGGARVLAGGSRDGALFAPTVCTDVTPAMALHREEVFAPIVLLETVPDFAAALREANRTRFGLQAGVFTNDLVRLWRAFEELDVGGVIHNDVPTYRSDAMPYGGVKESGTGREGVRWAIEQDHTELKVLVLNLPPAGGA